MRGKKLGTLRIDFKVSIEVLDDALCFTYEEIFDIIGIFFGSLRISFQNIEMKIILSCTYRISKFSLFISYFISSGKFSIRGFRNFKDLAVDEAEYLQEWLL